MTTRCLICETEIVVDDVGPRDATIWTSHGNFGSRVYDPDGSEFLEALICDQCLLRKKGILEEVTVIKEERVERRPAPF